MTEATGIERVRDRLLALNLHIRKAHADEIARAAYRFVLQDTRLPTEDMVRAGGHSDCYIGEGTIIPERIWEAMHQAKCKEMGVCS